MEPIKANLSTAKRILLIFLCLVFVGTAAYMIEPTSHLPVIKELKEQLIRPDAVVIPVKPKPVHLSKHVVEYHINVSYDDQLRTLQGEQTMTWTNPGTNQVNDLYFHMYPNAFQSTDTTFIQESGGKLRTSSMIEGSFGSMHISNITTSEGEEISHRMTFVQPDDNNEADHTLMRLRLPKPVHAGEKITLRMKFDVQMPHAFARMGVVDDYIMAGQWFPKIAVYEPAGTRNREEEGWNLHQYHGNSEFYADFGIYNVTIQVPDPYIVAATGFPTKPAKVNKDEGIKTYYFYADDVHDFAWAASPQFIYAEEPFSDKYVPGVRIKLYLDPKHEQLEERYFRVAKLALSRYSQWYGSYPYSTLSIVVPPEGGGGTAGMEYPTLITSWEANSEQPDLDLERVVAHEIGHQYWYGMVASNEMEDPWLDEAFTSYAELKLMQSEYDVTPNLPLEASSILQPASLQEYAWDYPTHDQYAENVYTRGKLVLLAIEREIGSQRMNKVLRTYFQRYKFKHPSTSDFQRVVEATTDRSWAPFFKQFVYGGAMLDYEAEHIHIRPVQKNGRAMYENVVRIVRHGGYDRPVPILFYFQDGTVVDRQWDGKLPSVDYKLTSDTKLEWVAVDPEHHLILENKHYNNILQANVDQSWKIRWNLIIEKSIETLIGLFL
ncbi:MAG: M1 family metallopeptidase [Paenibacillaceae bacterium]